MKKFLMFMLVAVATMMSANAENYISESKFFDNWYLGINGGATTPLSFDEVFPVNPTVGVRVGKDFSPVFGVNIEGTAWLGSHSDIGKTIIRFDGDRHLVVRGTNLGVNGTVNFTNLFCGYKGKPRVFEFGGLVGAGWWHTFSKDAVHGYTSNDLSAKTGVDLTFNLGNKRAHSLYVEPYVLWNLGSSPREIQFNKNYAQFGLSVGYTYHFKGSNGEHYFTLYDADAVNNEVNALRAELAQKPKEVIKEVIVDRIVEKPVYTESSPVYIINFAKGSSDLTKNAKETLDLIKKGSSVIIEATASPEGGVSLNRELSEERAQEVAVYLQNRGVKVVSAKGLGATGNDSQRIARVQVKQ